MENNMKKTIVGIMASIFCSTCLSSVAANTNYTSRPLDLFDRSHDQTAGNQESRTPNRLKRSASFSAFGNADIRQSNAKYSNLKRSASFSAGDTTINSGSKSVQPSYSYRASLSGKNRGYINAFTTHMKDILGDDFEIICSEVSQKLEEIPATLKLLKPYCENTIKTLRTSFSADELNKIITHDIDLISGVQKALDAIQNGSKNSVFTEANRQLRELQDCRLFTPALIGNFSGAVQGESSNLSIQLLTGVVGAMIDTMEALKETLQSLVSFDLRMPESPEKDPVYQLGEKLSTILEEWRQQFAQGSEIAVTSADLKNYISQNSTAAKIKGMKSKFFGGRNKMVR